MDTQTCKHCSALLYGETRCSNCGKIQDDRFRNFLFSLVFVLLLLCGIFGTSDKGDNTQSITPLATETATIATAIAETPTSDNWKPLWEDFLYGKTSSDCLSSGTQFCAGETVEYRSKRFLLLVWQTPRDDRVETKINPGFTTVDIPKEATSIHWEYNFGE